jgi:hypothetical protein
MTAALLFRTRVALGDRAPALDQYSFGPWELVCVLFFIYKTGSRAQPRGPQILILRSRPGHRRYRGSQRPSSSSKPTGSGGGLRILGYFSFLRFSGDLRPNLALQPLCIDGARPAVPVAPKISPADQFSVHLVAILNSQFTPSNEPLSNSMAQSILFGF